MRLTYLFRGLNYIIFYGYVCVTMCCALITNFSHGDYLCHIIWFLASHVYVCNAFSGASLQSLDCVRLVRMVPTLERQLF